MKEKFLKTNGITLIALVVTIVVLIILATISINAVMGENGLIKQAEKASQMQANAEASDNEAMDALDEYISNTIYRGLYFGQPYSGTMDGASVIIIFYEDGKADIYVDGEIMEPIPAGGCTYDKKNVYVDGEVMANISEDGSTITMSEDLVLTINTVRPDSYSGWYEGTGLLVTENGETVDGGDVKIKLEADKLTLYMGTIKLGTNESVTIKDNKIYAGDNLMFYISIDGTQLIGVSDFVFDDKWTIPAPEVAEILGQYKISIDSIYTVYEQEEIFTFTIANHSNNEVYGVFTAEYGMTWGEWVKSNYNTIGEDATINSGENICFGNDCLIIPGKDATELEKSYYLINEGTYLRKHN